MTIPMRSPFDYHHYKEYLRDALGTSGPSRGMRSRLAAALRCQTAFVSQVLRGKTHFSLEHMMSTAEFLGLGKEETQYLLLLVQQDRAGTRALQRHFRELAEAMQKTRSRVAERVQAKAELSGPAQAVYYSAWYYAAVHVLLSVPGFGHESAIADRLALPLAVVVDCLEFLRTVGLAIREPSGRFRIGKTRIHLGSESPLLPLHHTSWRLRAVQSLERRGGDDLHYSSVYSLSREDAAKIRALLLEAIERAEPILRESPEEEIYGMSVDLFRL
jgi:uncharacterized protein (TIGR02147 family)